MEKRESIAIGELLTDGRQCVYACWGGGRDAIDERSRSQFMNWSHYKAFGFYPEVNGESFKDLTRRVT